MASLIRVVKSEHDSIGGTVLGHISGMPIGLGEPCFDKLEVSSVCLLRLYIMPAFSSANCVK